MYKSCITLKIQSSEHFQETFKVIGIIYKKDIKYLASITNYLNFWSLKTCFNSSAAPETGHTTGNNNATDGEGKDGQN